MHNVIKINTHIKASLESVWAHFTQPGSVMQWNFANADWHCPSAHSELIVGGKFCYTMSAKDTSFSFEFKGTFTLVEHLKRIEYVLDDERHVMVTFETEDQYCVLSETFEAEQENPLSMQEAGWQAILNNCKQFIEQQNNG
jgi:uncharacterized protein YndB with AHSA1/START domain